MGPAPAPAWQRGQLAALLELLHLSRALLRLDPVRLPPDLRGAGEHGSPAHGGGDRPRRQPFHDVLTVTFPLSLPGVIAAFVFVLIPTTGEFIAPLYVGGPNNQLFGNEIQSFFGDSPNWNYGAVLAIALIVVVLVL